MVLDVVKFVLVERQVWTKKENKVKIFMRWI